MANEQSFQPSAKVTAYEKKTKEYESAVEQALKRLSSSSLGVAVQDAFNRIANRQPFSYDLNADGLYQQYKNQYITKGYRAMADTVAKVSENTGGYGNSYAQSAGQQAYGTYLEKLNEVVPQLYQLAYDRYNNQTKELQNQYELLLAQDKEQYSRLQEELGGLRDLADYYADRYGTALDYETDLWQQALKRADALAEFDYQKQRDAVEDAQWQKEYALSVQKANSSSSSSSKTENSSEYQLMKTSTKWDAGQWEAYFVNLKNEEGYAKAMDTFRAMVKDGALPTDMISFALMGIRGRAKGH